MKTFISIFLGASLILLSFFSFSKAETSNGHNGRCTGSASCSACSNCSRCGHCSSGGTCGVCSGRSSGRSFYSSGYTPKKKKILYTKSSNNGHSKGIYSASTKKTPVYYYNSSTSIASDNLLYTVYKTVNIRSGAGKDFSIVQTVSLNTKLIFLDTESDWYKVRVYDSGKEGYVYSKSVK